MSNIYKLGNYLLAAIDSKHGWNVPSNNNLRIMMIGLTEFMKNLEIHNPKLFRPKTIESIDLLIDQLNEIKKTLKIGGQK